MNLMLPDDCCLGILWGPIFHRWTDILNDVNRDGISVITAYEYSPKCENEDSWNRFIIDCYLSHEKIDNPNVNIESKIQKIHKKIKWEHLNKFNRSLCVFTFKVEDSKKITSVIIKELMADWDYTHQRIEENRANLQSKGHPYEMNIIKDIVRKRFYGDKKLPEYVGGQYAGRKRIMHTPVSLEGCTSLLEFLTSHPHTLEKIAI